MVTFDVFEATEPQEPLQDTETRLTIAPSNSSLSPSAPPPLPSSSLSFDHLTASTFAGLLTATLVACIVSGLTFQWLIEKGVFRKKITDKTNQYNVIVAIASWAACCQTILCLVQALTNHHRIFLDIGIVLTWTIMTHFSVLIVTRKVSLTDNDSERAWKRLLYWNGGMMVLTIGTATAYLGSRYSTSSSTTYQVFQDIHRYLEPIQIGIWGVLECSLSRMFIVQMKKYFWQEVERKGQSAMIFIALCDVALVVLSVFIPTEMIGVARGLVYTIRIRLELEVLSAMVTYIQNKRSQVVYMARKERRKRRKAKLFTRSDLEGDDNSSQGSHHSTFSYKNIRRNLTKRFRHSNSKPEDGDVDVDLMMMDDSSVFDVFRKRKTPKQPPQQPRRPNNSSNGTDDDDDDSVGSASSHISVFHRLPNATDYSNIFQTNFLNDFATATTHTGKMVYQDFKNTLKRASTAARDTANHFQQSMNITKATRKNSTSSTTELPIQGMEIKVEQSTEPELDLEDGVIYHYRRKESSLGGEGSSSLFEIDPASQKPVSLFSSSCDDDDSEVDALGMGGMSGHFQTNVLDDNKCSTSSSSNEAGSEPPQQRIAEPRQQQNSQQWERTSKIRSQLEELSEELSLNSSSADDEPQPFSIQRLRAQVEQLSQEMTLSTSESDDYSALREQVEQLSQELSVQDDGCGRKRLDSGMKKKLRAHIERLKRESICADEVDAQQTPRPSFRRGSSMGENSSTSGHPPRCRKVPSRTNQLALKDDSNRSYQETRGRRSSRSSRASNSSESSPLFGIPRTSFQVKEGPPHLDVGLKDQDCDDNPAPFGIPRNAYKSKSLKWADTPTLADPTRPGRSQMQRASSLDGQRLMPELVPMSQVEPRRISAPQQSSFSFLSQNYHMEESADDDEEPEELRLALEQLESLKCL